MIQQILLAITFVYGPLYLLTLTKLFDINIQMILKVLLVKDTLKYKPFIALQSWFFYFSLCYQSYYWLFKTLH